jgi:maleate isomerase
MDWDVQIIKRIEKVVKVPATTTSTSVISAFKELKIKNVAIGTPYKNELNDLEKEFFEGHGIKVKMMKGLKLEGSQTGKLTLDAVEDLAYSINVDSVDAIFLSCTNIKTIPIIARLEKKLGKYVISSNLATFWDTIRKLGLKKKITGWGALLESL